jgi:hypothetical protein
VRRGPGTRGRALPAIRARRDLERDELEGAGRRVDGKYGTWLTAISCVAADWCTAVGGVANAYYDGPPGSGIPAVQPTRHQVA